TVLTLLIGAPAFALTATTPLVSSWYARVRRSADPDADDRDPYWLYALSNGGSLVSLLAYPLLIEPQIGLSQQRSLWVVGVFGLLALLVVAAGVLASRLGHAPEMAPSSARGVTATDRKGIDSTAIDATVASTPTAALE